MFVTKREYRVWRNEVDSDEILDLKHHLTLADYRMRANAEGLGIDPLTISTETNWTGEAECRFTIKAPAPEEALAAAWRLAAAHIGLRTERVRG